MEPKPLDPVELRLEEPPKLEPVLRLLLPPKVLRLRLELEPKLLEPVVLPEPAGRLLVVRLKLLPLTLESELRDWFMPLRVVVVVRVLLLLAPKLLEPKRPVERVLVTGRLLP